MFNSSRRGLLTTTKPPSHQRLPWLLSESLFINDCTRCGQCIEACKSNIIVNGDGGYPTVDFSRGECTFCGDCRSACPEPLFTSSEDSAPWPNKAEIRANCLTSAQVECRSCSDHCPTQAIQFQLVRASVAKPKLTLQDCSGCGACVSVCPVGAIVINSTQEAQ